MSNDPHFGEVYSNEAEILSNTWTHAEFVYHALSFLAGLSNFRSKDKVLTEFARTLGFDSKFHVISDHGIFELEKLAVNGDVSIETDPKCSRSGHDKESCRRVRRICRLRGVTRPTSRIGSRRQTD